MERSEAREKKAGKRVCDMVWRYETKSAVWYNLGKKNKQRELEFGIARHYGAKIMWPACVEVKESHSYRNLHSL
jgi:hypothetical protein